MRVILKLMALALLVTASSCTAVPAGHSPETDSTTLWRDYGDLIELTEASDLVVEAVVIRRTGVRERRGHPAQRVPVAFTESLIHITNVLKGDPPSKDLRVVQLGKEGDPAQTYPEFPVIRTGSEVVLFLVDVSDEAAHADGSTKYAILPPVGLFRVYGGRLVSAASGFDSVAEATALSLQEFRTKVQAVGRR
jgi:limonene-1,2-epoxide hydrolase